MSDQQSGGVRPGLVVGIVATTLGAVVVLVLLIAGAVAVLGGGSSGSAPSAAEAFCDELSSNTVTAPDQIARRYYGDGAFAVAAAGIRSSCASEHGQVAVYLDDTATYDYGDPVPSVPSGYGTAPF